MGCPLLQILLWDSGGGAGSGQGVAHWVWLLRRLEYQEFAARICRLRPEVDELDPLPGRGGILPRRRIVHALHLDAEDRAVLQPDPALRPAGRPAMELLV